jgi:HAMP domain-containing protein
MLERLKLRWGVKLLLLLLAFALLPVAIMAWWASETLESSFEATNLDSLRGLANAKAEAVDTFTADRRSEVERIATLVSERLRRLIEVEAQIERLRPRREEEEPPEELPDLEDAEALPEEGVAPRPEEETRPPPPEEAEDGDGGLLGQHEEEQRQAFSELRQTMGLILWDQSRFEEIIVMDARGKVVASTHARHEQRSAEDLAYFRNGLRTTYVQHVFMSPISERLTMIISTPIRNEHHQVIGVLAARLNLSRFFQLINDNTGLGETGETIVGKRIDNDVVFMAPTRHDIDAALNRKVAIGANASNGIQEAARGQSGSGVETDYRGRCTLVAWQHVPSLEWGLAVKQDCAESMKPVATMQQRMLVIALVITVFVVIASLVAARAFVRPLGELKAAADRISKGDFDVSIDIRSKDEIGELADSFERMVAAIRFFREKREEDDGDEPPDEEAGEDQAARPD